MVKYLSVFAACVCATFLCVQGASIVEAPQNTTALVGQNVTLTCRVEMQAGDLDSLTWMEFVSSPTGSIIFKSIDPSKIHRPEKFEVFDTYNLLIKDAQIADGGLYACGLYMESKQHPAHVIILGKPEITVPDEVIELEPASTHCTAEFGSQDISKLDNVLLPVIHLHVEPVDLMEFNYTYEVKDTESGTVNVVHAESNAVAFYGHQHDKKVVCTVKSNYKPFVKTTTEKTIRVVYPSRTVTVDTIKKVYLVGDEITCKADGYPAPTIKWTNANEKSSVVNGGRLQVLRDMIGKKNKWNCSASNVVGGTTYEVSQLVDFVAAGQRSLHQIDATVFSTAFVCVYMFVRLFQS